MSCLLPAVLSSVSVSLSYVPRAAWFLFFSLPPALLTTFRLDERVPLSENTERTPPLASFFREREREAHTKHDTAPAAARAQARRRPRVVVVGPASSANLFFRPPPLLCVSFFLVCHFPPPPSLCVQYFLSHSLSLPFSLLLRLGDIFVTKTRRLSSSSQILSYVFTVAVFFLVAVSWICLQGRGEW